MSTVKISELTLLSNFDFDDEFVVVDDSAGVTKKTTGMYNQANILGTVSQSSGDPTGAIIERGSNANGEYVKFADGTMICTMQSGTTLTTTLSQGNGYRSSAEAFTFPHVFTAVPVVTYASLLVAGASHFTGVSVGPSTSSISLRLHSFANSSEGKLQVVANGRWY